VGGWGNKINESINTNTVDFFPWSQNENYFGSVNFCCQSAAVTVDRGAKRRSEAFREERKRTAIKVRGALDL